MFANFEGSKPVRQRILRPLSDGTDPSVVRSVEWGLTFDPTEPQPVTAVWFRKIATDLLGQDAFDAIDSLAETFRSRRILSQDGTLLLGLFYENLTAVGGSDPESSITQLERWSKSNPNSLVARYCLAQVYVHWAWQARGVGYASCPSQKRVGSSLKSA